MGLIYSCITRWGNSIKGIYYIILLLYKGGGVMGMGPGELAVLPLAWRVSYGLVAGLRAAFSRLSSHWRQRQPLVRMGR